MHFIPIRQIGLNHHFTSNRHAGSPITLEQSLRVMHAATCKLLEGLIKGQNQIGLSRTKTAKGFEVATGLQILRRQKIDNASLFKEEFNILFLRAFHRTAQQFNGFPWSTKPLEVRRNTGDVRAYAYSNCFIGSLDQLVYLPSPSQRRTRNPPTP